MYQYKTDTQIKRELNQERILFLSLGLGLGFSLACFIVYLFI